MNTQKQHVQKIVQICITYFNQSALRIKRVLNIFNLSFMIYSMVIQGGSSGLAYKLAMQWPASFCSTLSTKVFYYSVYEYICGAINIGYPQKDKKNHHIYMQLQSAEQFQKKNETLAIKREKNCFALSSPQRKCGHVAVCT